MPVEFFEWKLSFDTGWTLDYIRSLTMKDIENYFQVRDGMNKAGVRK